MTRGSRKRAASAPRLLCRSLVFAATLFGATPPAARAAIQRQDSAPQAGDDLVVYLMTFGQGDEVWEKFGHNALWIHDPAQGTDIAYNYGMFDFGQPGFYRRLVEGDMMYWVEGFGAQDMIRAYRRLNRTIWIQELALSAPQKAALRDFLTWNARPENRFYRYDYYRDNCSTRVRDAIDRVLGGQLRAATDTLPTGQTYRTESQRLTAGNIAVFTGLLLAMGDYIDRPLSAWEDDFIPMRLREHIRDVSVRDAEGNVFPLVRSERILFQASREPAPEQPPARTPFYLMVAVLYGATLLGLGSAAHRSRIAAGLFGLLAVAWAAADGLFGTVIAGLWLFTHHVATYHNENVLQINPVALPLILLVPLALTGRPGSRRWALRFTFAIAALAALGYLLQVLPPFDQHNGEIIALALPIHLGLAAGLLRLERSDPTAARPSGHAPTSVAPTLH